MLNYLPTVYNSTRGRQFLNKPPTPWGSVLYNKSPMFGLVKHFYRHIKATNCKTTWRFGYNYVGFFKGNYRWRRDIINYYWWNK